MAEELKPEENPKESKQFMTQTITGRKGGGERFLKFVVKAILAGAIFSAAAVATASFLAPRFGFEPVSPETTAQVVIERTEEESSTAESTAPEESSAVSESGGAAQETTSAAENSPSGETAAESAPALDEQAFSEAMEQYPYSMEDFLKITGNLREAADKADQSVVSVNHVREGTDWFANDVTTSGTYSGVVVAKTATELLILTTEKAARDADSLTVSLPRGGSPEATVKRLDTMTGLAVLTVPVTEENQGEIDTLEPVALGSSAKLRRGDFLITAGAPAGILHSLEYGFVSALRQGVSVVDRSVTVFYTDAGGNAQAGTWVLNTDGELVGWVTDLMGDTDSRNTAVLGISDYGMLLERMINGQASPYLGIRGTAVIPSAQEQGVPAGVYVSEVVSEGPAFEAGIQPGDVITRIGDSRIATMRDYSAKLETLHAQDNVTVMVMRNGREEYTGIEFQVTVGAR
ncbi:MAG: PDZ domain-containing protein [Stomatobaculum sp.]|nr:PDZ domain-containing protein [Stomatobaculum sp.]